MARTRVTCLPFHLVVESRKLRVDWRRMGTNHNLLLLVLQPRQQRNRRIQRRQSLLRLHRRSPSEVPLLQWNQQRVLFLQHHLSPSGLRLRQRLQRATPLPHHLSLLDPHRLVQSLQKAQSRLHFHLEEATMHQRLHRLPASRLVMEQATQRLRRMDLHQTFSLLPVYRQYLRLDSVQDRQQPRLHRVLVPVLDDARRVDVGSNQLSIISASVLFSLRTLICEEEFTFIVKVTAF
mmetsp:Transcript_5183/g.11444  ORF Transcript_5183/g.11444 Transcript_5183/m.11444 type:complete len:235 (+) Transcript_5183:2641-3345(+)